MSKLDAFRFALLLSSCLATVSPLRAQSAVRLGSELQVNSYTTNNQTHPKVARDGDGDFVVAWHSSGQDGFSQGIFARRFSAIGAPQATEFQVSSFTAFDQRYPDVDLDSDGDFVVAWESNGQDGDGYGIFARRFNASGVAQGAELQVSTYTTNDQSLPAVGLDADGDFVIAWQSKQDGDYLGVFARRFNSAGVPQAAELQVNSHTQDFQYRPAVDLAANGDFVVAWDSLGQDGDSSGVFARRFNASGTALAVEFRVNSHTPTSQRFSAVTLAASGDFVISWQSYQDGGYSASNIFARRFSAAGSAQGAEFRVNSYTQSTQSYSAAAMDDDGSFVIAWASDAQDDGGYDGVFAQRFDAAGVPLEVEFQVNSYTPGHQSFPALGVDPDGDFVVAWASTSQDGSGTGIFAQRFVTFAILDIDANGTVAPLTDGLLVLRYLFGFTDATLLAGAVDTGACTRCDAASIQSYLQTLI